MNITLVIPSLGAGGAERVACILSAEWLTRGYAVTLVTLSSNKTDFFSIPYGVHRVALGVDKESQTMRQGILANIQRIKKLRLALKSSTPDVIISFIDCTNVLTLFAASWLQLPVIVSERAQPQAYALPLVWNILRRVAYRNADALVVQTQQVREWAKQVIPTRKIFIIPNPVRSVTFRTDLKELQSQRENYVIAMGSLTTIKGFDLLIQAFARIAHHHRDWKLIIYGDGPEKENLLQQCRTLQLEHQILLPGKIDNVDKALCEGKIFVLSSRHEGFPNVLLEAMSCGLVVVSFDCPSGPGAIIQSQKNGVLVPPEDVESLARSIQNLIIDENERLRLASNALSVQENFRANRIADQWDQVFSFVKRSSFV